MAIDRKKIEDYLRNAKFPMDWAEFAEVMRLAGVSAAGTSKAFNDFNRAAKLQQDRQKHWQQQGHGGSFRQRAYNPFLDDEKFFNQYARGSWSDDYEYKYTYDFNVDDETYKAFTKEKSKWREHVSGKGTDYSGYVAIPELPGWSAPSNYNRYSTGDIPGCHTIIKKDAKVNNHSSVFETIPFQFIPPELF